MELNLSDFMDTDEVVDTNSDFEDGFKSLEPGWYRVEVTESIVKQSEAGNPGVAQRYEVIDCPGGYSKYLSNWFNLVHPNDEVVRIAKQQFQHARNAIGQPKCSNAGAFEGEVIEVKVKKIKATEQEVENGWCNNDGHKNSVVSWRAVKKDTDEVPFDTTNEKPKKENKEEKQFNWMK